MASKRLLLEDEVGKDTSFVKRLKAGTEKYSNVIIRVGPGCEEFAFFLFPLVVRSAYIRRRAETVCGEERDGSILTINLPDFPHGPDIFRTVQDFCCGVMEENDICVGNVVKLLATSEFLEIESLKNRVWKFLETKILNSKERIFEVLATFDDTNLPGVDVESVNHSQEDCLFGRCKRACLPPREYKDEDNGKAVVSYNVIDLFNVAKTLPESVAERIYQSFIVEQCRFNGIFCLYYIKGVVSYLPSDYLHLYAAQRCPTEDFSETYRVTTIFSPFKARDPVGWTEELQQTVPNLPKRSLLILYLTKLVHPELQMPVTGRTISSLELNMTFLCGLLVEAAEIVITRDASPIASGLVVPIAYLEKSISQGLSQARISHAHQRSWLVSLLQKFRFDTLLSIMRHYEVLCPHPLTVLPIAEMLDACLAQHLQDINIETEKSTNLKDLVKLHSKLSMQTANRVNEDKLMLETKLEEAHNRAVEMEKLRILHQEEREEREKELSNLRSELISTVDSKKDSEKKLTHLQNDLLSVVECKKLVQNERDSLSEGKRLAELERDALRVNQGLMESQQDKMHHDLDEEKEKTTCQICLERPRDAVCLPCLHFLYCSGCLQQHHDRQSKTCPACQSFASGVLKCNLSG